MKGDIQKFNNYKKIQEDFEEVEEFVNDTKDDNRLIDVDNDGDLDSPEEIEAGITHVEIVSSSDLTRFKQLNVTADAQVGGEFTQPQYWHDNDHLLGSVLAYRYRASST